MSKSPQAVSKMVETFNSPLAHRTKTSGVSKRQPGGAD